MIDSKKIRLNEYYDIDSLSWCWAKSKEKSSFVLGTVRVIGGILMTAWRMNKIVWLTYEVSWIPVDRKFNTPENARKWVANL